MAAGILAASFFSVYGAKKYKVDVDSMIVILALGISFGIAGAKGFYLVTVLGVKNILPVLRSEGLSALIGEGFVFYGGLLFGALGAYLGTLLMKESVSAVCFAVVPALPLGHAFGRLGCFFAGCCYGVPYDGPGSVVFPVLAPQAVFPVQLLESFLNLLLFALLLVLRRRRVSGEKLLLLYFTVYSVLRFLLEYLRGDSVRGAWGDFSTSQWISLLILAASVVLFLKDRRRRRSIQK